MKPFKEQMHFNSKICHIDANKAIVEVSGWKNNLTLGSAIGEAKNAEEAEDRAIARLKERLDLNNQREEKVDQNTKEISTSSSKLNSSTKQIRIARKEINNDDKALKENNQTPDDWSKELTEVDAQISRLNWNKNDENKFIKYIYGYESRKRITDYRQITILIDKLKSIQLNNTVDKELSENGKDLLISISNIYLKELSWDEAKGREYIKNKFNVLSRGDLNTYQLQDFNKSLKSLINK